MHAKMAPKMLKNRAWGRLEARFLSFRDAFSVCRFSISFGHAKSAPKSSKMAALGGPRQNPAPILGGSAAEAVVLGRVFRAVLQVLGQVFAE